MDIRIDKLFLNSAIEALQATICLGMFGVIEEMGYSFPLTALGKMFEEFAPVIGLDSSRHKRSHLKKLLEEITAIGGRV